MITVKSTGDFKKTEDFFKRMTRADFFSMLDRYGTIGVNALANATPVDSGLTANSWFYEITHKRGKHSIIWHNTNVNDGVAVAILIQYGHGTGTGGWVQGYDYINPAIQPLFDQIANDVWEQVKHG